MAGGGCWLTAMQNCWMLASWLCIAAMVFAWLFIDSCVAAYVGPKCASDLLYDAIDDRRVVVHGGHAIPMLHGWDRRLVDECDRVGPILFEGVDRFGDPRSFVLAGDPPFVFLGVHPASLDDAQADVDDVAIVHRVAGRARVGSTDEEASCEGLEAVGGMPVCGHSLSILFAIFCCCFTIFHDEPIEHV